ncbi:MAG: CHC2 zinc finger domain-containing protein [Candidatus Zixiibacteriota bacterium]
MDEIKARVSIEDILAEQGISLKRGRCRCVLHDGDNPTSFSVRDGVFHCFACDESGDVVCLVQKLYRLDFKEALRYLARKAGISEVGFDKPVNQRTRVRKRHTKQHVRMKGKHDALALSIRRWERVLKQLEQDVKGGKISLSKYYADQQLAEHQLARLDEESILRNYERNMRRKERWKKPC